MRTDTAPAIHLKDYRPPAYEVAQVDLTFELNPVETRVLSRLSLRRGKGAAPGTPLVLDGQGLLLEAIALNGVPLAPSRYRYEGDQLFIADMTEDDFVLETTVTIDPSTNKALMGLYVSDGFLCTQCEAEGFRRITFYPDRPDVLAPFKVRMVADKAQYPVLLSNGNLTGLGDLSDGQHWVEWEDPFPKPCYLFALVAGDLAHIEDRFTTKSGRDVTLRIYVEHGKEDRCGFAMEALIASMRWDEDRFGLEYDLDIFMIVAVSAFNFGAMENKGLNIFNDKLVLARPDLATDTDYERIESVIAHEYFHNWTGNRVTCRDWFQLCLKEGLTVFRDQLFSADLRSAAVKRIDDVQLLRLRQFAEDAGPLSHPVRPSTYIKVDNFYTATVYEKGAELCRMLQTLLGGEAFRKGIDLYFERHDGTAATVEDFIEALADGSDTDLSPFLGWYDQAGTPNVSLDRRQEDGRLVLYVTQHTPPTPGQAEKRALPIPLRIAFFGDEGELLPFAIEGSSEIGEEAVVLVDQPQQHLAFQGLPAGARVSVNRGFTSPIVLHFDRPMGELIDLFQADTDWFSRWEAGQEIALGLICDRLGSRTIDDFDTTLTQYIAALSQNLTDDSLEPAFLAQLIGLPGERDVIRTLDTYDPAEVTAARETVGTRIALALADQLATRFKSLPANTPYQPDAKAAGVRSLRHGLLRLLAFHTDGPALALSEATYRGADNMTDRMNALSVLNHMTSPVRDALMADFFKSYENEPLVLDKWFMLQATSKRPSTLEEVKSLTAHQAYRADNPNRVRALIGSFANGNLIRFHDPSGAGYEFFINQIIRIDRINPLTSSRLLPAVADWFRLEPGRRDRLQQQLQRLQSEEGLSDNLKEVADKTIAAAG